ncbi:MAG: hypothetical protein KKC39_05420 [Candidatus Omnitrophica bacterium]|nr:hypothetical protein [Candidatus Omnitrophota bacterium]MBU4303063.1 hypothetical protein [Candidatus Omnitrophota bacterium]MBU4418294.1 hypothetical protein [Candidatus Omnitrophota bacterium]MBU4468157.1 hypothetical protein [Candidatus Omnitrophota bacterium]MCG2707352.1 hypothetical protein [Candidatus Omnitrophota bacterium]
MVKKYFLLAILFVFMFLASGCLTVNVDGRCSDKQPEQCTKKEVKVETRKEVKEGPGIVKKADNWVRENLW